MAKRGRPPKTEVEETLAQAICDNLEIGMPLDLAAEAEGVPRSTVRGWIADFEAFAGRVTRAKATGAKKLHLQSLDGSKSAQMALAHLERRFREFYGIPKNDNDLPEIKITIEGGMPKRPAT